MWLIIGKGQLLELEYKSEYSFEFSLTKLVN